LPDEVALLVVGAEEELVDVLEDEAEPPYWAAEREVRARRAGRVNLTNMVRVWCRWDEVRVRDWLWGRASSSRLNDVEIIYTKFDPHIRSLYISELDLPRVSSVCFPSSPQSSQPTGQNTQICRIIKIIVHIRKASRDAPNGVDAAQRSGNELQHKLLA
jgi:hypothetical protein